MEIKRYRSWSRVGASELHLCSFVDEVVLLASLDKDLHHTLRWFAVELLHSWDESRHLQIQGWSRVAFLLPQVRGEQLSQVEKFKYLGIFFRSEDDRRIDAAATV